MSKRLEHGRDYKVGDVVTVRVADEPEIVVVERIVAIVQAEDTD